MTSTNQIHSGNRKRETACTFTLPWRWLAKLQGLHGKFQLFEKSLAHQIGLVTLIIIFLKWVTTVIYFSKQWLNWGRFPRFLSFHCNNILYLLNLFDIYWSLLIFLKKEKSRFKRYVWRNFEVFFYSGRKSHNNLL